jgi:hypothetical protein
MTTSKKPKKRKKKKTEYENYEIEIEDYEVDYHFGINFAGRCIAEGDYWEGVTLKLLGKLLYPELKNASKAEIVLSAEPGLDNHWKATHRDNPPYSIGRNQILNENETLFSVCWIPASSLQFLAVAVSNGKVGLASMYGEKLKWRQGSIFRISLSTTCEED